MKRAVIFDFDGVVADTESLHWQAFQTILEPMGLGMSWEAYLEEYIGYDDRDAFRTAFSRGPQALSAADMKRLIRDKAAAFVALAAAGKNVIYPGAPALIRDCAATGWALAICSGALRNDIEAILRGTDLLACFGVVVTAEDVTASKPDPESYRRVVELLKIDPTQAVVIEDTPAGIASARGAGLRVVGVTTSHDASALIDATHIVPSISDITPALLEKIVDAEPGS